MNASLVSGLSDPIGLAVSGSNLFVASYCNGTIGEYTTSGADGERLAGLGVELSGGPCRVRIGPVCREFEAPARLANTPRREQP